MMMMMMMCCQLRRLRRYWALSWQPTLACSWAGWRVVMEVAASSASCWNIVAITRLTGHHASSVPSTGRTLCPTFVVGPTTNSTCRHSTGSATDAPVRWSMRPPTVQVCLPSCAKFTLLVSAFFRPTSHHIVIVAVMVTEFVTYFQLIRGTCLMKSRFMSRKSEPENVNE